MSVKEPVCSVHQYDPISVYPVFNLSTSLLQSHTSVELQFKFVFSYPPHKSLPINLWQEEWLSICSTTCLSGLSPTGFASPLVLILFPCVMPHGSSLSWIVLGSTYRMSSPTQLCDGWPILSWLSTPLSFHLLHLSLPTPSVSALEFSIFYPASVALYLPSLTFHLLP